MNATLNIGIPETMGINIVTVNRNLFFTEFVPNVEAPMFANVQPVILRPDASARILNVFLDGLVKLRNRRTILIFKFHNDLLLGLPIAV
jgi:hypothetical protein